MFVIDISIQKRSLQNRHHYFETSKSNFQSHSLRFWFSYQIYSNHLLTHRPSTSRLWDLKIQPFSVVTLYACLMRTFPRKHFRIHHKQQKILTSNQLTKIKTPTHDHMLRTQEHLRHCVQLQEHKLKQFSKLNPNQTWFRHSQPNFNLNLSISAFNSHNHHLKNDVWLFTMFWIFEIKRQQTWNWWF